MGPQILLNEADARSVGEFLGYFSHCQVRTAVNEQDIIRSLRDGTVFAAAVAEINLPGRNGLHLLRLIKSLAPELPVIVYTSDQSRASLLGALKAHAEDYIEKSAGLPALKACLGRYLKPRTDQSVAAGQTEPNLLARIKGLIERHREKILTLKALSRLVFLTPKYISAVFKKQAGICLRHYTHQVKMAQGKALLTETCRTVDEIAHDLGYKNAESFIRRFKKLTGQTPARYRLADNGQESGENGQ